MKKREEQVGGMKSGGKAKAVEFFHDGRDKAVTEAGVEKEPSRQSVLNGADKTKKKKKREDEEEGGRRKQSKKTKDKTKVDPRQRSLFVLRPVAVNIPVRARLVRHERAMRRGALCWIETERDVTRRGEERERRKRVM